MKKKKKERSLRKDLKIQKFLLGKTRDPYESKVLYVLKTEIERLNHLRGERNFRG